MSFEIHWVRQYLVNVVLYRMKDPLKYKMTPKLKSNMFVWPVSIIP